MKVTGHLEIQHWSENRGRCCPARPSSHASKGAILNVAFWEGVLLGAGLLIALGPKDTFVIKSSLRGNNAVMLVLICASSDVLLITLGVAGLGAMVVSHRWVMVCAMVFSIAYLLYFSVQALRSGFGLSGNEVVDNIDFQEPKPNRQVAKTALFHSLLTPYAWLDTVLVIGAISATKLGEAKIAFAAGTMISSVVWFGFLTVGARMAAPLFRARRAWQVLDLVVALSMAALALKLLSDWPWKTV